MPAEFPQRRDHFAYLRGAKEPIGERETGQDFPLVPPSLEEYLQDKFGAVAQIAFVRNHANPVEAVAITRGWADVLNHITTLTASGSHVPPESA